MANDTSEVPTTTRKTTDDGSPYCGHCKETVKAGATRCPHCGSKLKSEESWMLWAGLVGLLGTVFFAGSIWEAANGSVQPGWLFWSGLITVVFWYKVYGLFSSDG